MAIILIVEDEQQVRQLLEVTLSLEHQVLQASNAAQAIKLARLNRPDLVLLDLDLERDQDGLEVCRTLRKEPDSILAQVPIVMLTGQTTKEDIGAALKAGANSYMSKPYSPGSLRTVVTALLGKRSV